MTALTISDLKTGLDALTAAIAAYKAGFENIGDDETAVLDAAKFAEPLIGGEFATVAPVIGPLVVDAIGLAIEYNRSAEPGALTHIASGNRGSAISSMQPPAFDE